MTEREDTVRRGYAALSAGDLNGVMAACHDDVVWDWSRSLAPFAGVYSGRAGLRSLYDSFMLAASSMVFEVEHTETFGEHVIAHVKVHVRGHSGAEGTARSPHVLTFDGDRFRRHTLFQERAEAVAFVTAPDAAGAPVAP